MPSRDHFKFRICLSIVVKKIKLSYKKEKEGNLTNSMELSTACLNHSQTVQELK